MFDIFNPQISVVSHDMDGKTILVYGDNRLGKTKQATRLKKPFYFPFENGLNGIAGVPFLPIQKWSDFVKINKSLTNQSTLAKAKENYQTLIFDTLEAAYMKCEDYICAQYGVMRVKDGNQGYGLWREVGSEFWKQINLLTSAGYTVYFIAHETEREITDAITGETYVKKYPRGDKRAVDPICDLVDIIAYLKPNGIDENGKEIPSSAYFTNTLEYKAGSRFDYLAEWIEEFTAENLESAIYEAVQKQQEIEGIKTVSFKTQQETTTVEERPFEDIVNDIKKIASNLNKAGRMEEYQEVVNNYLGQDGKVKEAHKGQIQQLELILNDLQNLISEEAEVQQEEEPKEVPVEVKTEKTTKKKTK
jgi:hypothetical protein